MFDRGVANVQLIEDGEQFIGGQGSIREAVPEEEARGEDAWTPRDRERTVAPLIPAEDAMVLDTSGLGREEAIEAAIAAVEQMAARGRTGEA